MRHVLVSPRAEESAMLFLSSRIYRRVLRRIRESIHATCAASPRISEAVLGPRPCATHRRLVPPIGVSANYFGIRVQGRTRGTLPLPLSCFVQTNQIAAVVIMGVNAFRIALFCATLLPSLAVAKPLVPRLFPVTEDGTGQIPSSQLPSTTATALPTQSAATTSNYTADDLNNLWSIVEQDIAVEVANATSVQEVTNFTVPTTPSLPYSLQDHAGDLKFPEGFRYGVASAAQQWEGAVKADGRGPSSW
jgi:hypothetical protein